jgi:hypothetical protein
LVGRHDRQRAGELLRTFKGLDRELRDPEKERYAEMGRYAEVIGRDSAYRARGTYGPIPLFGPHSSFKVNLKKGVRWAEARDLGSGPAGDLRRKVRERFGATLVALDYNRDGKPDLFLVGAVVENGQVRDLLLRNDGDGLFTDVTGEAGLDQPRAALGCCVADFDNDGYPDLFLTGIGGIWLFRNGGPAQKNRFDDVTAKAGLDKIKSVCLGACFLDLDHDGDLDLVIAQYAGSVDEALHVLAGKNVEPSSGSLQVYLNVGEARPVLETQDPPPLNPAFKRLKAAWLDKPGPVVGMAATDLQRDGTVDLVVLGDRIAGEAMLNNRLLRFQRAPLPHGLAEPRLWNGVLVLDANHDGRSDLFAIGPDQKPAFLLSRAASRDEQDLNKRFETGPTNSPPLRQAQAFDLDYDGWTDIVGLSTQGQPVLLHNEGGKLVFIPEGLGSDKDWPTDLLAVTALNFDDGKHASLLVWSEKGGLQARRNLGNTNQALKLELTGHRRVEGKGTTVRCNADGIGVWVVAQTSDFRTGAENTTLCAGLGQSRQPLVLGLGPHSQAEVVRMRWPDNCWQAEMNKPACHVVRVEETNRKGDSCPLLFAWDGQRFGFVADFLGAGVLGEALPTGGCRQPRPEESVKIEAHQLVPKDGFYVLKVAEPMDEVTYLDRLQLVVVDHPAGIRVYPEERFVDGPPYPSQELRAFRAAGEVYPVRARDHKGRDVTATLRHWDRDTVSGFARRTWAGFAEEHWIELDFGDRLAHFGSRDRLMLCLAGWTDYPYPDSIWAAEQAGIPLVTPVLERRGDDGRWHTVISEAGFPAGLPRMILLDVTGKLGGKGCVLRLRTNMQIFWDQVFVAPVLENEFRATPLEVSKAILEERGCMKEYSPDGREPLLYDYHRLERVPVNVQSGRLTRLGPVADLLRARDDRFVIFGPGDEITVHFDARGLPPLLTGWKRSFVLRTAGYCKGCGIFTLTGDTVEPLPFQKMRSFPYEPGQPYPRTPRHEEYLRQYNTRLVGAIR